MERKRKIARLIIRCRIGLMIALLLLAAAKNAFEGPRYSRIVLEPAFRNSDRDFNTCMEAVLAAAGSVYGDNFYTIFPKRSGGTC